MALSVIPVVKPADLANSQNGKLFPSQLGVINLPGVGAGTLHPLAVRAFNCLFLMAKLETGQTITAVSNADDYRSYEMQLRVFMERYTPGYLPWRNTTADRRLGPDGTWWFKRIGKSPVASPGQSNHGWGLALDCALWNESKVVGINSNALFWGWLAAPNLAPAEYHLGTGSNAESFGLSWETQSEPWHLRLVVGDKTAQRVLDIEKFLGVAA